MIIDLLPASMKTAYGRHWFNDKRRRSFYQKVAELYRNGVKIDDIVASIYMRSSKRDKNGTGTWVYKQIMSGLASSGSLAQGLSSFVPTIDNVLIKAGEQSGNLAKTLDSSADLNEKTGKMKTLIRKALTYPCVVMTAVVAMVCWFSSSIFPTMAQLIPVEEWPGVSRGAYKFGMFMTNWYWLILILLGVIFFAIAYSFAHMTGPIRIRLDKMPPWSLYRLSQGGAWILSVSSMVGAGTINTEALNIVYKQSRGNQWLQERTRAVRDNITKGQNMGNALTTKYMFPDEELCEDMGDYAKSGDFNAIFEKIGKEWIETGVTKVEEQSKKLNGLALGVAMMTVAWLVQAIVALMMSVANMMSSQGMG